VAANATATAVVKLRFTIVTLPHSGQLLEPSAAGVSVADLFAATIFVAAPLREPARRISDKRLRQSAQFDDHAAATRTGPVR
jgi:hypothetical protein